MKANKKLGAKPNRVILNCETNKAPNIAKKLADKMGDSYIKLEEELSNQQHVILTERQLFPCEIVDCDDYETYSEANDKLGERMYEIAKDKCQSFIFPYMCANYIAAYKWKYIDGKFNVERYILKDNGCFNEEVEQDFLSDLDSDYICDEDVYKTFLSKVRKAYPEWNVVDYGPEHIGDMMEQIYYGTHPGPKGVLCRAQMLEIARNLNRIPLYNLFGGSPEEIIERGLTNDMLKVLCNSELVDCLYTESKTQAFISAYTICSGIITQIDDFKEQVNRILNYQNNSKWVDETIKKQNEEHCLVYGNEQYIIISANSIKEIINEAVVRHTSLVYRLESVTCGAIRVLFLRRTEHMNIPFVSIIVRGSCIENVYDEYNRLPDIEVFDFLNRYKLVMGLQFDPCAIIQCAFEDMDYAAGYSQEQLDKLRAYAEAFNKKHDSSEDN